MDEKNPLHNGSLPLLHSKISNRRGRPTIEKSVKFSPQPRSMVAQMLQKMRTENATSYDTPETYNVSFIDDINEQEETYEAKDITCKFCSHRSNNSKDHKKHLTTHKQYACDYPNCSYSCKLSSNLIKHKRIHTGERPYLCDRCSFRSNFVNSLKVHKRIHTSERPFQCKHCIYKCNSSSNLKKHCHHKHPNNSLNHADV